MFGVSNFWTIGWHLETQEIYSVFCHHIEETQETQANFELGDKTHYKILESPESPTFLFLGPPLIKKSYLYTSIYNYLFFFSFFMK